MPWPTCALAARYDHPDPNNPAVIISEPYDYPPEDTSLEVFCDIPDFFFSFFIWIVLVGKHDALVQTIGLGGKPEWGKLFVTLMIGVIAGGFTRFVFWSALQNLRNRHVAPPGVHTAATGLDMPRFMYAVSSIHHWPRRAWRGSGRSTGTA
jgi:hypothetical protein